MDTCKPGPLNAITDVPGVKVGHHTDTQHLTGTTVVLVEAVAGVDVRGSAPGTRETDLLDPSNLVQEAHAIVLSGGSAYGLAAANGVVRYLEERGIGFPIGDNRVVPIVPGAVLFDLDLGPDWTVRPDAEWGYQAALRAAGDRVAQGNVGAGTGASAGPPGGHGADPSTRTGMQGGVKGGLGTASTVLPNGIIIGAIVAVNPAGLPFDPLTGELYARFLELEGEFGDLPNPAATDYTGRPLDVAALFGQSSDFGGRNTTIGAIAVNARLDKAQARKVAQMAHDGLARAIRPAHTLFDGDTIFTLATGDMDPVDPTQLTIIGSLAADTMARAVVHGLLHAEGAGGLPSYREAFGQGIAG